MLTWRDSDISPHVSNARFSDVERKLNCIKAKLADLRESQTNGLDEAENAVVFLPKIVNGKRGANKYDIHKECLEHLLTIGCSVKQIADEGLLGKKIHPNTTHNFIKANGMKSISERFSQLPGDVLKEKIIEFHQRFPNSGIREIKAMLNPIYAGSKIA